MKHFTPKSSEENAMASAINSVQFRDYTSKLFRLEKAKGDCEKFQKDFLQLDGQCKCGSHLIRAECKTTTIHQLIYAVEV